MTYLILGIILFHGLHSLRIVAPEWRNARTCAAECHVVPEVTALRSSRTASVTPISAR